MKTQNNSALRNQVSQFVSKFNGQKMYLVPDSEIAFGGDFDEIARANGYSSGRAAVNDMNLWASTVNEAVETVTSK